MSQRKLSPEMESQIVSQFLLYQEDIQRNRRQVIAKKDLRELYAQQDKMVAAIVGRDIVGIINAYENGAVLNDVDRTYGDLPLNLAMEKGYATLANLMLYFEGIDVNVAGKNGNTPLHVAAQHGDFFCIKKILRQRGDVMAKNEAGEIPLACLDHDVDQRLYNGLGKKALLEATEFEVKCLYIQAREEKMNARRKDFQLDHVPPYAH